VKKILILFLLIPFLANAQMVIFCENVDHIGNPKNESSEFTVSKKGGFLKLLVRLGRKANTNSVVIDIFRVKDDKRELDNSIKMTINPFMTWFYKEVTFFKEGEYQVNVYDEKGKMLAVGKVLIKVK
jgi:hypothetical protein